MKREHVVFLATGFAFGILFGYGLFNLGTTAPDLGGQAAVAGQPAQPSGPRAPGQVGTQGDAGAAPMMAEINGLKRRLKDNPRDADALARLANIYHEVAMWEQAIEYYELALEVRPDEPDWITDMGVCQRNAGRFEEALSLFGRAQEVNPDHWQSLFNTAIVAGFDLERWDVAFGALESMERMDPQPPRLAELRQAITEARDNAAGES